MLQPSHRWVRFHAPAAVDMRRHLWSSSPHPTDEMKRKQAKPTRNSTSKMTTNLSNRPTNHPYTPGRLKPGMLGQLPTWAGSPPMRTYTPMAGMPPSRT